MLQYIFRDEQQPLDAQFIHDPQVTIDGNEPDSLNQSPTAAHPQRFAEPNALFGQSLPIGGYTINADLVAKTGEFNKPAVYQRLYHQGR